MKYFKSNMSVDEVKSQYRKMAIDFYNKGEDEKSIVDIAKLVREYVKNVYPTYKFSVTSNNNLDLSVSLMEYSVELTNVERMKNYLKNDILNLQLTKYLYTEEMWDKYAEEMVKKSTYNEISYFIEICTWINPIIRNVLSDIRSYILLCRYGNENSMMNFVDKDFRIGLYVGKSDKPSKFVEKELVA